MPEHTPRIRIRERLRSSSSPGTDAPLSVDPSPVQSKTAANDQVGGAAPKIAPDQSEASAPAPASIPTPVPVSAATAGSVAASYEIGYRKPPKATQFQPGRSGNPKGRPKNHFTIAGALQAELNAKHPITINGREMHLTQAEIVAKQMCKKAMAGDPRATALIMKIEPVQLRKAFAAEPRSSIEAFGRGDHVDTATFDAPFSEAERAMLKWVLSRGENGEDDGTSASASSSDVSDEIDGNVDDDADQQTSTNTQDGPDRRRVP